jgi:hypothetical protein
MGLRIEAPKQEGNARFNTLKVNLQQNLAATRAVVVDNDGRFYYGNAISGSGASGSAFPFTGSAIISGSLTITGSLYAPQITGSLFGTASWAQNALTASFVTASNVYGPFGSNSVLSASYSVSSSNALSSSLAQTASFITASNVYGPFGSNSILSASYAVSSSLSQTASIANNVSGGATNYITIWNSPTTLSSSTMYQSASNVGVGTLNPFQRLTVLGTLELGSTQSPQGGAFLYRNYLGASNNYINVVGSEFSSGAMTLGYGVTGKAGASGYTSTLDVITIHRGVLNIGAGRLDFLQSRQAVNTPVGNDVPMTSSFSIEQNGLASFSDSVNISGSLNVSSSITASNALITNTLTVQTIVAQVITSSTDFVTGSTRFGTQLTNTHVFTGSVNITGSLTVNGPLNATASWAQNALTASFVTSSNVFGPFGSNSILSASYSVTSSFAISSSYSLSSSLAQTASFITASNVFGPFGSNSVLSASFASSSREIEGGANRYITMWSGSTRLTSSVFYQDASNNIGLGTITPQARLHVYRDVDPSLIVGQSGSAAKQTLLTHYTSGNGYFYVQSVFQGTAYTPIILNEQGGNVGVGLLSPTAKLHVSGTTGGIFEVDGAGTAGANALYVSSSGNVGLGTISPVYKLDVSGSARVTSSLFLPGLTTTNQSNIITVDTTTGQLYYTASSAYRLSGGTNNYVPLWTGTSTLSSSLLIQSPGIITAYGLLASYIEQPGSGTTLMYLQNRDTTAGVTHQSRLGVQQLGAGVSRTLLYAASPNTSDTAGEIAIISENGGQVISTIGKYTTGVNNTLSLYVSGSPNTEVIRLHSAGNSFLNGGNVGIGTTSPRDTLDVVGSIILRNTYNLSWGNTYGAGVPTITGVSGSSAALAFYPAGSTSGEKVRIDNNGNVGIGVTSPTAKLHVSGTTGGVFEVDGAAAINALYVSSSGNVGIGTVTPTQKLEVAGNIITGYADGRFIGNQYDLAPTVYYNGLQFNATNRSTGLVAASGDASDYIWFGTNSATERMRIINNGNVGIGNTSPTYKLDITGTTRITSTVLLPGLTTTNQSNIVTVDIATGQLYYTASSAFAGGGGGVSGGATNYIPIWTSPTSLSSSAMYQNSSNIGVGTTSPLAKLHVSASGTVNDFLVGSSKFFVSSSANGFVGVGTVDPAFKFSVVNVANFSINGNIGVYSGNVYSIPASSTFIDGRLYSSVAGLSYLEFAGNQTIAVGSIVASTVAVSSIRFTNAGSTITNTQLGGGVRTVTALQVQTQTAGTITGTIQSGSSILVQGVYPTTATSMTFNNYFGIAINPLDDNAGVTINNKWAIYQTGANDRNYFNGQVGIKVISPAFDLHLANNSAGKPTTNTWTITSDGRVKTNIQPYTKGLDIIKQINPITYQYNGKAGFNPNETGIGIIAQDILGILPECVSTYYAKLEDTDTEKTELYNFDSHAITFVLINAIKEQQQQIDELRYLLQNKT